MAGHSKFKNIMHRKGAQDAKRAKIFTKIAREIFVAAKEGDPDPTRNPRLRLAISNARSANMPKDKVEAAIKKASNPTDADTFTEIRYEGYGPSGVAVVVEVLTDNKNRSAAEVRSAFTKAGGSMGENGSVAFMFNRCGIITYPISSASFNEIMEAAIEFGAEDCEADDDKYQITTSADELMKIAEQLETKFGQYQNAELTFIPLNTVEVNEDTAEKIIRLIDVLEENDDVQKVVANFDMSDEILAKLKS